MNIYDTISNLKNITFLITESHDSNRHFLKKMLDNIEHIKSYFMDDSIEKSKFDQYVDYLVSINLSECITYLHKMSEKKEIKEEYTKEMFGKITPFIDVIKKYMKSNKKECDKFYIFEPIAILKYLIKTHPIDFFLKKIKEISKMKPKTFIQFKEKHLKKTDLKGEYYAEIWIRIIIYRNDCIDIFCDFFNEEKYWKKLFKIDNKFNFIKLLHFNINPNNKNNQIYKEIIINLINLIISNSIYHFFIYDKNNFYFIVNKINKKGIILSEELMEKISRIHHSTSTDKTSEFCFETFPSQETFTTIDKYLEENDDNIYENLSKILFCSTHTNTTEEIIPIFVNLKKTKDLDLNLFDSYYSKNTPINNKEESDFKFLCYKVNETINYLFFKKNILDEYFCVLYDNLEKIFIKYNCNINDIKPLFEIVSYLHKCTIQCIKTKNSYSLKIYNNLLVMNSCIFIEKLLKILIGKEIDISNLFDIFAHLKKTNCLAIDESILDYLQFYLLYFSDNKKDIKKGENIRNKYAHGDFAFKDGYIYVEIIIFLTLILINDLVKWKY